MAGGGSSRTEEGKKKARIEIIPLIDVIFFLLATFVLFTLSLNKTSGVRVELPKAATAETRDPSASVTISVLADGGVLTVCETRRDSDFVRLADLVELAVAAFLRALPCASPNWARSRWKFPSRNFAAA